MYLNTIIEPEWDAGFLWRAPPQMPTRCVPGLGLVDQQDRAVEVFRGSTEAECWRAAFLASDEIEFGVFQDRLVDADCVPYAWLAVCPGRTEPARWFYIIVPRELL